MAPGGIEPPRVDSKSTALSTELRGRTRMHGILCGRVVAVAQLVEPRVVIPVVAGSSPVRHPRRKPWERGFLAQGPPSGRAETPIWQLFGNYRPGSQPARSPPRCELALPGVRRGSRRRRALLVTGRARQPLLPSPRSGTQDVVNFSHVRGRKPPRPHSGRPGEAPSRERVSGARPDDLRAVRPTRLPRTRLLRRAPLESLGLEYG